MEWITVVNMLAAMTIIVIVILSGSARLYVRKKFDVSEHFTAITEATKRQQIAKRNLHNAQIK